MLNQEQTDLFIGTLLGDGNLGCSAPGNEWRYRATHGPCQREYIFTKYNIIKDFCGTEPKLQIKPVDKRTGKQYITWYFNTLTKPDFEWVANMFYKWVNKPSRTGEIKLYAEKDVPINIKEFLTPRAIAWWFQDDGSAKWQGHSNAMRFSTDSFSLEGVKRLQDALQELYGIESTIEKKKKNSNQYILYLNEKTALKFIALIRPYIDPSMTYKLPRQSEK